MLDENAMLAHSYQTWGRTIEYEFVEASGTDEATQRADAVNVIGKKPFAVMDTALYAQRRWRARVRAGGQDERHPRAIRTPMSPTDLLKPYEVNTAEWAGKQLVGSKAQFGGDAVKDKTRVFGVVYQGGSDGMDLDVFTKEFAKYGGKIAPGAAVVLHARPPTPRPRSAAYQEQAPTLIAKLKHAGVTTVVNFAGAGLTASATGSFTKQATSQDWFPEWVVSGVRLQGPRLLRPLIDQEQWPHAFGPVWFTPYVAGGASDAITALFQWYWGKTQGTHSPGIFSNVYSSTTA